MRAPLMHLAEGGFLSSSSEGDAPQILSTEEEGYSSDPLPGFNNAPGFMSTVSRLDPMIHSYLQDPIPYVPYVPPVVTTLYVPNPEGGESSDDSYGPNSYAIGIEDDVVGITNDNQLSPSTSTNPNETNVDTNSSGAVGSSGGLGGGGDESSSDGSSSDAGGATEGVGDYNMGGRIPPLYAATGSGVTQGLADSLNQTTKEGVLDFLTDSVLGRSLDIFSGVPNLGSTVFGLNTGMSNKAEVEKIHELQGLKDPSFLDYVKGTIPGLNTVFGVNTPQSDFKDKVYDSKIANNNIYGPPDPTITTKDIETSLGINTIPPVTIETLPPVPFEPPIITIPEVKIEQLQTESDKDKAADVAQQAANDAVNTSSGYTDTSNNYGGNDNDDGGSTPGDSSGSYGGVGDYNMGGLIPPPNMPKRKIDMKFNIMLDPLG